MVIFFTIRDGVITQSITSLTQSGACYSILLHIFSHCPSFNRESDVEFLNVTSPVQTHQCYN